jgi:hypothetical protein
MEYDGGKGDDRPHFRALCEHLGVSPIHVTVAESSAHYGKGAIADGSVQSIAPCAVALAAFDRIRELGAEAILTGAGSEILLDASPDVFRDFFLRSPARASRALLRYRGFDKSRFEAAERLLVRPLLRSAVPTTLLQWRRQLRGHRAFPAWAGPVLRSRLGGLRETGHIRPHRGQRERVLGLPRSPYLATPLESLRRLETVTGLPILVPFLDDAVATFLARVPSSAIFAGGRERGLLRESMAGMTPDSLRYRTDKGSPLAAFRDELARLGGYEGLRDLVEAREMEAAGLVEPEIFRRDFEKFAANPDADPMGWGRLWPVLTGEAYLRWFRDFAKSSARLDDRREQLAGLA